MTTTKCTCGQNIEYDEHFVAQFGNAFIPVLCGECVTKMQARLAEGIKNNIERNLRSEAQTNWDRMCPPIYKETIASRLPYEQTKKVLNWKMNSKGLMLLGETGKGKTRCAFLLMERLIIKDLLNVMVFHGNTFAHLCSEKFLKGEGESWIRKIVKADVVFFDDLGKFKLTERVEAELSGVIEMRTAYMRPIIATTNFTGATLVSKLSEDRGAPMVRRLREFCESVQF